MAEPRTLSEKVWDAHVVRAAPGEPDLLYIDLHLIHEVTSPQAFDGLRLEGRPVHRPDLTIATADHNVPTVLMPRAGTPPARPPRLGGAPAPPGAVTVPSPRAGTPPARPPRLGGAPAPPGAMPSPSRDWIIDDPISAKQVDTLSANCAEFGIPIYPMGHRNQGIVHVIGPDLGLTQPGLTIVCGDSHTSTHGAFGALAFGIGSSEVEHVLATQALPQSRPRSMAVTVSGDLPTGVTAKDLILAVIGRIGTGGGAGHIIEYRGSAIRSLSMEGRMTVCNMSVEGGARAGMVAPDETTFAYIEGRPHAPKGEQWEKALDYWRSLATEDGATFDREVEIDAGELQPHVSWGTNPSQVASIDGSVPDPDSFADAGLAEAARRALVYMNLKPGTPIRDIEVDTVFIGSCTNSRLEDLRAAADVLRGRQVRDGLRGLVVPGSMTVKADAEAEGLDRVFTDAGFEWRAAGCSMCLGMNPDQLSPGERCASTSNRNFEGRQGRGGRTHLVSPAVAAATAVAGRFALPGDI